MTDDLPDQTDAVINHLYAIGESAQAEAIEILVARLAQAEADLTEERALHGETARDLDESEAALVSARRDAALVAAQALMGIVAEIDDIETAELVTRRAIQFEDEARAALVVADTGEGLSKTSAKPLVLADTQKATGQICGRSRFRPDGGPRYVCQLPNGHRLRHVYTLLIPPAGVADTPTAKAHQEGKVDS